MGSGTDKNKNRQLILNSTVGTALSIIIGKILEKTFNIDFSYHIHRINDWIVSFMNMDIKIWHVIVSVLALILLYIISQLFYKKMKKEEYLSHSKIMYRDVLWSWEWKLRFRHFKFEWHIYNVIPLCPKDGTPLTYNACCPMCYSTFIILPEYINDVVLLVYSQLSNKYPSFRQSP